MSHMERTVSDVFHPRLLLILVTVLEQTTCSMPWQRAGAWKLGIKIKQNKETQQKQHSFLFVYLLANK